ncbi:MAG: threonine-phosphate decarboxylase CobD [Desulfobacterales bacterium]|nr:threonine-phosphate decarboxylase CobD [Desulfobacterales bacterium]
MIHGHGGNIYQAAARIGCQTEEIVDMSSNVNPLGPPPGLHRHLQDRLADLHALPEPDAAGCCRAFARRSGIDEQWVMAGNGTTQFIYALPRVLNARKALIAAPTYADYADACTACGVSFTIVSSKLENGFAIEPDRLKPALADVDLAFFCNPNNPTGVLTPVEPLARICRSHPQVRFVVDESYLPFVADADDKSMIRQALPNVLVLNSLSKVFRIPGLRIGFLIAPPQLIEAMRRLYQPWSVNSLAQAAVEFLMRPAPEIEDFLTETRRFTSTETARIAARMANFPEVRMFPGAAIFSLLLLPETVPASRAAVQLLEERILIRNCENFAGLSDRYIRISLKTPAENDRLVEALGSVLRAEKSTQSDDALPPGRRS